MNTRPELWSGIAEQSEEFPVFEKSEAERPPTGSEKVSV
jgi:hypothetical protein